VRFREADVLSVLRQSGSKGLKSREIARRLKAGPKDLQRLRSLLYDMESQGTIARGRRRRYTLPGEAGLMKGHVYGYGRTASVFVALDENDRFKISDENLGGARHGDLVLAKTVRAESGEKEARVARVLERAPSEIVGRVSGKGADETVLIESGDRRETVTVEGSVEARAGDHVVVRVPQWRKPYERTPGKVVEVLGATSTWGEDFAAIIREFNLPLGFPQSVLDEVGAIPDRIAPEEIGRREDLRKLTLFTIDPHDAKDFDDAISVEDRGDNRVRVGVHIADVSHYVAQGSELDNEAMARGRSVYLADRVIPMLPARLSGDMASLKPGVPRLAVSVFMEVDAHGQVHSHEIKESVVESKARLTYEEAQALIDKGAGWRAPRPTKEIAKVLASAERLRRILKDNRIRRGAIEIDTPEVHIVVDDSGNTVDIKPAVRLGAHNLIEELMILANETIAGHMAYLGREFIYRIHEVPDVEDMMDLARFAAVFGYRFRWTKGTSPRALQSLLEKVEGRPEHYIMSMSILRSLKKAVYSERNVGHFGLASKCYTHFTSPIRRYPDLVVHRLVKRYGLFKSTPEDRKAIQKFVRQAAEIASMREMEGDEAERASTKARVAEFMESRIGEEHWGIVSGVRDFGIFVMLEDTLVEGLVHVSNLGGDYYVRDETGTGLIGSRTGRLYRMGDRVRVRVSGVDRARREVDFEIICVEERSGRGIVVPAQTPRDRRRRQLGYAAEVRKARASRETPGSARAKAGRRARPSQRRKSASGAKAARSRRPGNRGRPRRRRRPGGHGRPGGTRP
jgi:ribonuclease R